MNVKYLFAALLPHYCRALIFSGHVEESISSVAVRSERRSFSSVARLILLCAAVIPICTRPLFADESLGVTQAAAGISSAEVYSKAVVSGREYRVSFLSIRPAAVKTPVPVALYFASVPLPFEKWPRNILPFSEANAIDFALRGYLTIAVIHDNYRSPLYTADSNGCSLERIDDLFKRNADYLRAVVSLVAKDPHADMSRIIVVSNGPAAFDSLAFAAREVPGLKAIVNIGGGISQPNCTPNKFLETLLSQYRPQVPVPSLWLYARDDPYLRGDDVKRLASAYSDGSTIPELKFISMGAEDPIFMLTSTRGRTALLREIDSYLSSIGLPSLDDNAADIIRRDRAQNIPADVFRDYLLAPANKALALSASGKVFTFEVNQHSLSVAASSALSHCRAMSEGSDCHIIILNNQPQ